jgi:hypothetical protein
MPGRADLIQENNARASAAAANTPQHQENQGKSATSGIGGPRSFLGGNIDVYSALDKVEFQGGLGDFSLRGNIAYIRLWKRGGSAQQSAASVTPAAVAGSNYQEAFTKELDSRYDNLWSSTSNLNLDFDKYYKGPTTNDDDQIFGPDGTLGGSPSPANYNYSAQNNFDATGVYSSTAGSWQKALSSQTPTSSATPSATTTQAPPTPTSPPPAAAAMGAVKSANPSGFLNTAANVGRALVGLPQGKPEYSGQAAGGGSGASSAPAGEMMWQFLFNPSELELEVGPEFKDAETWGVSDKGNSGKPLHWSHNKNAQLKFNSVLLNGYVFGRKVEVLEQGLIELFMARDGEGQHGPHVLEFVWGKRVFGPCVIKNVNIKEKMWDEGEVVNAEVSFTLEQVPEWTINDGFVDVARPGRQQLATNPVPGDAGTTAPVTTAPAAAPGGGAAPDQKPPQKQDPSTNGSAYRTCQKAYEFVEVFSQVEISGNGAKADFRGNNGIVLINELFRKYEAAYSQGNSSVGTNFISRVPAQQKPPSIRKSLDSMITAGAMFERQADLVRNAALRCKAAMQNVWDPGCKQLIASGKTAQIGAQNANNNQALCSGITVGRPCNIGAGNFSPKNPCSGKVLRCNGRGVYEDI